MTTAILDTFLKPSGPRREPLRDRTDKTITELWRRVERGEWSAGDLAVFLLDQPVWVQRRAAWLFATALHPDPEKRRPQQLVPAGDWWRIAAWVAGRGYGKTRIGAEDVCLYCSSESDVRYAGVFEKFGDGRDVAVEGDSGIMRSAAPDMIKDWNRSLGEIIFTNGSRFKVFSSERPDQLRGPQFHRAWMDEPAKFRYLNDAWTNLMFGLRLGQTPQVIVTGTPKPIGLIREFVEREGDDVKLIRGTSFENAHNLAPAALRDWIRRYAKSRLGRQELFGEILEDFEGALFRRKVLDRTRRNRFPAHRLIKIAIGVDPSGFSPEGMEMDDMGEVGGQGKETGIVVVGIDDDPEWPHCWVLDDLSGQYTGEKWAHVVVDAFHKWDAIARTVIVPEVNLNGPAVLASIRLIDPMANIYMTGKQPGVRAAQGKRARAEPVGIIYEQRRVHHVGNYGELEDTMCTWDPKLNWSPDRLDALVWAMYALEPWNVGGESDTGFDAILSMIGRA